MVRPVPALRVHRPLLVFGVACNVAAARALDLWSTRVITPDLAGEQNVVLAATGGAWIGLMAMSLVVLALVTTLFALAVAVQTTVRPKRRGLSYDAFLRAVVWGRPRPLRDLLRTWPPRRRWLWCVGRFLPWAVVATSLVAAMGNMAAYWWPVARPWWALMVGNPLSQVAVLLGAILASALLWSQFEYARYRAASRAQVVDAPSPVSPALSRTRANPANR